MINPAQPPRRGRPATFGERTVIMRIPDTAKAEVVEFLTSRQRSQQARVPRPHTVFAGGIPLSVLRAAQNPTPFEIPTALSRVPAGFPSPADDYLEEGCDLNQWLVRNRTATYFFSVSGDSVDRLNIVDGDRVVVDCSLEPQHGDIVIAIINGEGHTIKRLHKTETQVALEPDSSNPIHKRRVMTEFDEWMVWGVVTSVVRKLKG